MERISEPRPNIRLALVGSDEAARKTVSRRMSNAHNFSFLSAQGVLRKFLVVLYNYNSKQTIPWERRFRIYDALYAIDHEIWVRYLARRLENIQRDVVVPDCRFLDEIQYLRKLDFQVVRIVSKRKRKFPPSSQTMTKVPGKIALSEYYSRGFDELLGVKYSINQDDTAGLRKATDELVEKLRRERDGD